MCIAGRMDSVGVRMKRGMTASVIGVMMLDLLVLRTIGVRRQRNVHRSVQRRRDKRDENEPNQAVAGGSHRIQVGPQ